MSRVRLHRKFQYFLTWLFIDCSGFYGRDEPHKALMEPSKGSENCFCRKKNPLKSHHEPLPHHCAFFLRLRIETAERS